MKFLNQNYQKEPWQIAAARYCINNAERGFTKKGLEEYIRPSYSLNERHIEQFYDEEIYKPVGREHTRSFVKTEEGGLWIPPLDLVSKITDHDELQEVRKNAKNAFWLSIVAIIISSITLVVTI
ncbi:MAG: hypothetical protein HYT03_01610 [Candidatus Harrisonbacteria bacterium]|nr:hypothetical protein [Candidatus Harrisonbacteria bacterium]